jgi:predicted oxidoreductase (fatty acid repression mutant protein)
MDFYDAIKNRRSFYALSAETTVPDERIIEIIEYALKYTPSAFNCQSARAVVLFGENHKKLWEIAMSELRKVVPAQSFAPTEEKINSFAAAHGTVLYFNDTAVTNALCEQYPLYKDNFPVWAQQANGMLQFAVWTSLESEGLGASLQHYNPLIDEAVKKYWKLPESWQMIGQMPFGKPAGQPGEKDFIPTKDRMLVF